MGNNSCKQAAFQRILVAVDRSKQSEWATAVAGGLAEATGANRALVHAFRCDAGYSPEMGIPIEELLEQRKAIGWEILRRHQQLLPADVAAEEILIQGDAATEIGKLAESWGADLIVMGTHGRGRLGHFLIGSTAEDVIRTAHCPVLAVRPRPARKKRAA